LLFQSGIVEIKKAFRFIGVSVAFAILDEEADRTIERVDHDLGGFASLGRDLAIKILPEALLHVDHVVGPDIEGNAFRALEGCVQV
jgi:hypothetical protein